MYLTDKSKYSDAMFYHLLGCSFVFKFTAPVQIKAICCFELTGPIPIWRDS